MLLRSPEYGPPVDLFAMGAIIAEMFSLRPLFPGSSEVRGLLTTHHHCARMQAIVHSAGLCCAPSLVHACTIRSQD